MQETVVETDLNADEVLTSIKDGIIRVGVDNSVRGETQYFLCLTNHYEGMYDYFRTVFIGSIPGADIVEEVINGLYTGRMSDESIDFLMKRINGNSEFVRLVHEDLS